MAEVVLMQLTKIIVYKMTTCIRLAVFMVVSNEIALNLYTEWQIIIDHRKLVL